MNKYMRWISDYNHPEGMHFIISKSPLVPFFYIYMYSDSGLYAQDLESSDPSFRRHQDDYTQNTLEKAKECALREFGVPVASWKQVE